MKDQAMVAIMANLGYENVHVGYVKGDHRLIKAGGTRVICRKRYYDTPWEAVAATLPRLYREDALKEAGFKPTHHAEGYYRITWLRVEDGVDIEIRESVDGKYHMEGHRPVTDAATVVLNAWLYQREIEYEAGNLVFSGNWGPTGRRHVDQFIAFVKSSC